MTSKTGFCFETGASLMSSPSAITPEVYPGRRSGGRLGPVRGEPRIAGISVWGNTRRACRLAERCPGSHGVDAARGLDEHLSRLKDAAECMMETQAYDVVVVGSGSAGAMAALRARELGLSVLIIEKAHKYGGTSATSGGVLWIPNHGLAQNGDSREQALQYLNHLVAGNIQRDRLAAFVDQGPEMVRFMQSLGIAVMAATWPDYFPDAPGARADRSIICPTFDGRELGEHFTLNARAIHALQAAQSLCDGSRRVLCAVRASQGLAPRAHEDLVALLDRLRHSPHQPARSQVHLGRRPHGSDLQADLRAQHRGAARNQADRACCSPTAK